MSAPLRPFWDAPASPFSSQASSSGVSPTAPASTLALNSSPVVAPDEGEDLEWLVQGVSEGDLRDAQPLLPGENFGAVEAPEVLLVAVGLTQNRSR